MADFADRSLGIGYVGGSLVLSTILVTLLCELNDDQIPEIWARTIIKMIERANSIASARRS